MKKRYETPTTRCIKVAMQQMIAMSLTGTTDETLNNLSREVDDTAFESSVWDEFDTFE